MPLMLRPEPMPVEVISELAVELDDAALEVLELVLGVVVAALVVGVMVELMASKPAAELPDLSAVHAAPEELRSERFSAAARPRNPEGSGLGPRALDAGGVGGCRSVGP